MTNFPESHADLLDAQVAALATVGPNGIPQTTLVWFLHEDGDLKISLSDARRKTKNLMANPVASLLILDADSAYRYLEVRGHVRIDPDEDYAFADRVGVKYGGADLRAHDGPGDRRVIVTLEAANVYAVDMRG